MQRAFQAVFRQLDDRSLCNLLCGKLSDKGWIPHPLLPQIGIIVDHNTNIYNAPIANGNRMKHQSLGNGISPCFLHLSRGGLRQAITNLLQFYRNFLVIPKSTKQSTSWGVRVWYKERQPVLVRYRVYSNRCLQELCHWKVIQLIIITVVIPKAVELAEFIQFLPSYTDSYYKQLELQTLWAKKYLDISYTSCPWELWAHITHGKFVEGMACA